MSLRKLVETLRRLDEGVGAGWTDGTGVVENAIFVDGQVIPLWEQVQFLFDPANLRGTWRIQTPDSHNLRLTFTPAQSRTQDTNLGILRNATGDSDGARRSFESALAIHRELAADHPTITAYQSDLAMSHNNLGAFLSAVGDQLGARRSLESAQAIWRKLADDHPTVTNYQSDLAGSHYNLGLLLRTAGDMKAALRSYESAQAIRRARRSI